MSFIENIEKEHVDLTFTINSNNKLKVGFVNGLRRILISDIPIYGVSTHKINFINNTCMFDDEFLKHRLGLVSVRNDVLKDFDDVVLSINKKNEKDEIESVYLKDFKVEQRDKEFKNEDLFRYPNTLLTKLKPGQVLELEASLEEGIGRQNARFSPVSTAFYHFDYDKDERDYIRDKDDYPVKYIFTIESSGQLMPKELLLRSINVLKEKLNFIKNDIERKTGKITNIMKSPTKLPAIDIHINNETDTIGNLITQYALDIDGVEYSGYHMPHPLKKLLILRFAYKDNSIETITKLVGDTVNKINKLLDEFEGEVSKI